MLLKKKDYYYFLNIAGKRNKVVVIVDFRSQLKCIDTKTLNFLKTKLTI